MAGNPFFTQFHTQKFEFIGNPEQRDGTATKDQRFVNVFPELIKSPVTEGKKYYIKKRPGLNLAFQTDSETISQGRGIFYWPTTGQVYSAVGSSVYANNIPLIALPTSTGPVGFVVFMNSATNTEWLVCIDGQQGFLIDTTNNITPIIPGAWTPGTAFNANADNAQLSDRVAPINSDATGFWFRASTSGTSGGSEPDWNLTAGGTTNDGSVVWTTIGGAFPIPQVPTPVYFDNYLCIAKQGTGDIYNSDLGDPLSWEGDNFLTAESFPDPVVALCRNMNMMVAVGSESVEFFYDAGNPTGSPFTANEGAVQQLGSPAPMTVNQTEREVIFVGTTNNGGRTVWTIDTFQPHEIAIEPVRQALDNEGTSITDATAYTIQSMGHKWYVLNLKFSQRTFVYDFEEDMWHEWTMAGTDQVCFNVDFATDSMQGQPYMVDVSNGNIYLLDEASYTDNGDGINCEITTVKIDFDTLKRKRYYRLSILGDSPDADVSVPITVAFSDDDYNTWSNARTLEMNADYPTITQLGTSRRRAFQFTYNQPFPLRLEAFEVDIVQEVRR